MITPTTSIKDYPEGFWVCVGMGMVILGIVTFVSILNSGPTPICLESDPKAALEIAKSCKSTDAGICGAYAAKVACLKWTTSDQMKPRIKSELPIPAPADNNQ